MVNFFASWCVACKAEHAVLSRLVREKGITIYGVNCKDKAVDAAKWLSDLGIPYAHIGIDLPWRAGIEWGISGVPETFAMSAAPWCTGMSARSPDRRRKQRCWRHHARRPCRRSQHDRVLLGPVSRHPACGPRLCLGGPTRRDPEGSGAGSPRARAISAEVRCVVCQNESIDTSNAGIARDLRILIRKRLTAGDSDGAIFAFLVARYGDFVLRRPPFKPETSLLWLAPFAIMLTGGGAIAVMPMRPTKRGGGAATNLSADAERALIGVLKPEPEEGRS